MRKVLILSFSVIHSDPRVMRQVHLLESRHNVTVAGYGYKPHDRVEFVSLTRQRSRLPVRMWWGLKLLLGFSESYYWNRPDIRSALEKLADHRFDLVIANDLAALPLALRLARGQPVLIDAHEYSPREFDDQWLWRLLFGRYCQDLCRCYLPRAASMITVCQGIADEYARQFGVNPLVVHNAPLDQKLPPSHTIPGHIRMIHHGAPIRSRHLETMIDVMKRLDRRFTLDFMLTETDPAYLSDLRQRAADDERIRFVPAVPMADICRTLNKYDLGIYLLPPLNFNQEYALPNKFFEFIQARLAVAIGPSPEMVRISDQFSLGVIAPSFEPADLAAALSAISDADLVRYKVAANAAAATVNYEKSGEILLGEIQRLLLR